MLKKEKNRQEDWRLWQRNKFFWQFLPMLKYTVQFVQYRLFLSFVDLFLRLTKIIYNKIPRNVNWKIVGWERRVGMVVVNFTILVLRASFTHILFHYSRPLSIKTYVLPFALSHNLVGNFLYMKPKQHVRHLLYYTHNLFKKDVRDL